MRVAADYGPPVYPPPSVNVTIPSEVMPDDLMLLALYLNQPGATVSPAATWQTVFDQLDVTAKFRASFFERRAVIGEPSSYDFPVANTNLAAWALVVYRNAPALAVDDQSLFLSGAPSPGYVTYTTPSLTLASASNEVAVLLVDDSGSTATSATPWTPPPGMSVVVDGSRVAILAGAMTGPGSPTLAATVSVPNTTTPHGAVRALSWAE